MKKVMGRKFWIVVLLLAFTAPIGCGRAKVKFLKAPESGSSYKNIQVGDVVVTSDKQGEKYDDLNTKFASYAKETFIKVLKTKGIYNVAEGSSTDVFTLESKTDIAYGSRALRYFVGFGAGTGYCTTILEVKDSSGEVKIKTETKSKLSMGGFGGSMDKVIKNNIKLAIKRLVSQL